MVPRADQAHGRPSRQDDDRRPGSQAAGRALEVCNGWRSDRGGCPQARLSTAPPSFPHLPGPDQSRRIQVDEPHLTMAWKSRSEEWSRPPEPSPDASGMLVQLPRAATECEFDLVPEPGQVMQKGSGLGSRTATEGSTMMP